MTEPEPHEDEAPGTEPVPASPSDETAPEDSMQETHGEDAAQEDIVAEESDETDDPETAADGLSQDAADGTAKEESVAPDTTVPDGTPDGVDDDKEDGETVPSEVGAESDEDESASADDDGRGEQSEPSDEPLDLSRSALASAAPDDENDESEAVEETPVDMDALRRTVEALLFAAEGPLAVREIARAAGSRSNIIRKVLKALKESLETEGRPWELMEVAGGWRFATRPEYFPAIQKLKVQRSQRRLTPAAMEVLALIAYSQEPIGRAEIEAVRGVDSGPVLRLLLDRKLIRIAGRGQGLGQPLLYAVTQEFLEHFGLKSTKELPQSGELRR